jgi:hypothetical protein
VLIAGARASRYADDLLTFARRLTRPTAPAAAALAMARRSELEGRLLAILDPAMKRTAVRRARVALLTLAVMILATPLAAFRPAARATTIANAAPDSTAVRAPSSGAPDTFVRSPRTDAPPQAVVALPETKEPQDEQPSQQLEMLIKRVGGVPTPAVMRARLDTIPPQPVDIQTLIEVTRALKKMTADHEKGTMLAAIAKRYQPNDALRDAYLDVVFTMSSDHERSRALIALLERDSIPPSSTAKVLRAATTMSSDYSRTLVLKRINAATFADSTVQRAYLEVITLMSSNTERASAISSLVKQRPLTPIVQLGLIRAISAMTSNTEQATVLLLFHENQGIADETVRRAFLRSAETLTSDHDYRRVMASVLR